MHIMRNDDQVKNKITCSIKQHSVFLLRRWLWWLKSSLIGQKKFLNLLFLLFYVCNFKRDHHMKDLLLSCPQCGEDMKEQDNLCYRCQHKDEIDNMTDADFQAALQYQARGGFDKKLSRVSYSTYSGTHVAIAKSDPEGFVKYIDEKGKYQNTPFTNGVFEGWQLREVAKHVHIWLNAMAAMAD